MGRPKWRWSALTVYAPHNLKESGEKVAFYDDLGKLLGKTSTNGPKLIFGDFNARLRVDEGDYEDFPTVVGPRYLRPTDPAAPRAQEAGAM